MATQAQIAKLQSWSKLTKQARVAGRKLRKGTPERRAVAGDIRRYRGEYSAFRKKLTGSPGHFRQTFLKSKGGQGY